MNASSTNGQENTSVQEVNMEMEHINKKPIKRIVPEKIAEVGQWKAAKEEAKAVTEEDKIAHKHDKPINEEHKTEISTEDAKTN